MKNEWTEVGQLTSEEWDRTKEIIGTLTEKKNDVGPNHSKLYVLDVDGVSTAVWGGTVLDTKFAQVEVGCEVKIVPLGKATSKAGKEYSDYQVFKKPVPFKEVGAIEIGDDSPPIESYEEEGK